MIKFLSIGTSILSKDLFLPISNPVKDSVKPTGGLWLSVYNEKIPNNNAWADYLGNHPHLIFFKGYEDSFSNEGVLVNLKRRTKVLVIHSNESLVEAQEKYPWSKGLNYEKIAKDYDAIYINPLSMSKENEDWSVFDIPTLILFNLDAILDYQKATIDFYDTNNSYKEEFAYEITIDDKKQVVLPHFDSTYQLFIENLGQRLYSYAKDQQLSPDEILDSAKDILAKALEGQKDLPPKTIHQLQRALTLKALKN